MTYTPTPDDVERGIDGLYAEHDQTYHVHAAECCMSTDKYTRAVLAAVAPAIAARALEEAADEFDADDDYDEQITYGLRMAARRLRARADRLDGAE